MLLRLARQYHLMSDVYLGMVEKCDHDSCHVLVNEEEM